VVLATAQTVDFIYVCENHLTDPGFASPIADPAETKKVVSAEEIAKVKEEWEAKQKRKAEKAKEKEKKEGDDKEEEKKTTTITKEPAPVKLPITPPTPPTPTHKKYALHRDMFALRLTEHRKRRQTAQVKALAPRLPGAPRDSLR
jgi:AAA-ATPase Vps4-associated protein 1